MKTLILLGTLLVVLVAIQADPLPNREGDAQPNILTRRKRDSHSHNKQKMGPCPQVGVTQPINGLKCTCKGKKYGPQWECKNKHGGYGGYGGGVMPGNGGYGHGGYNHGGGYNNGGYGNGAYGHGGGAMGMQQPYGHGGMGVQQPYGGYGNGGGYGY